MSDLEPVEEWLSAVLRFADKYKPVVVPVELEDMMRFRDRAVRLDVVNQLRAMAADRSRDTRLAWLDAATVLEHAIPTLQECKQAWRKK